nr:hypothetical protein [uncultured Rhodopila sp.]
MSARVSHPGSGGRGVSPPARWAAARGTMLKDGVPGGASPDSRTRTPWMVARTSCASSASATPGVWKCSW